MKQHLFQGQTCLQIIITIYCNIVEPEDGVLLQGRLMRVVCVYLCGYCIYIIPGNVKVSKCKEINITPVLT